MKELHTELFVAPTGVGKTHLALSLLETKYINHFDFIVIICPTLTLNRPGFLESSTARGGGGFRPLCNFLI